MKNDKPKKEEEQIEVEEPEEVVEVDTEKEQLQQLVEENDAKYKRALADYHNLSKRVNEEKGEWIRSANKELLLRLLPILDTLMLVEKHIKDQGITVSINQFLDILKTEGVIRIKTVGEDFDPYTMECVTIEAGEENKVLEELRAGYLINDKVLRAAQVKVGRKEN
jgi:molecular chaperone GrpE